MNTTETIAAGTGTVVDVRSPEEFSTGHVPGSVNVPLHELSWRINDLRKMKSPLVLCCASGNRSGMAAMALQTEGIDCVNGGGWRDVENARTTVKIS